MTTRTLVLTCFVTGVLLAQVACTDSPEDRCGTGKVCGKDCSTDEDCDFAYTCNKDGRCESTGASCKTNELTTDCGADELYCCATGNSQDCCDAYSRCSSKGFCVDRITCLSDADCVGGSAGDYARCGTNHQCEYLRPCDGSCTGPDEFCSGTVCIPRGTCLSSADCATGELCSTGYRCLPDNSCGDAQFVGATAIKPNILLALDRSGSMQACLGVPDLDGACCGTPGDADNCTHGMTSRWEQAIEVIRNVTLLRESDVRFGISVFPRRCGDAGVCDGTGFCTGHVPCETRCNICGCNAWCDGAVNRLPGVMDIPVDEDMRQPILSFLNLTYPGGGTPTGPTLRNIRNNPSAAGLADAVRNNAIVLITDGEANSDDTSISGCGSNAACKVDAALDGLRALPEPITTFVVGFAFDQVSNNLNCHAVHGGSARTDTCPGVTASTCDSVGQACYYDANDASSLATALENIITLLASCNYVLDDAVSDPTRMYVYLEYRDGQTLPADCSNPELRLCRVERDQSHITGWDLDGTQQQLDFAGGTCDLVRTGAANPVIVFGCPPSQ